VAGQNSGYDIDMFKERNARAWNINSSEGGLTSQQDNKDRYYVRSQIMAENVRSFLAC
jgi:hypothetical protein